MSVEKATSIRDEMMDGPYGPLLDTDQQDRLDLTKAAHTFGSVPTRANLNRLRAVMARFKGAKVSDEEMERFEELVRTKGGGPEPEPEIPQLTDEQREFLESLTPEQLEALAKVSDEE